MPPSSPEIESLGGIFRDSGSPTDPIALFASRGVNTIRLRLWNNPPAGYCDLAHTLAMAQRIHAAGLRILLDFHYSDSWADPGQQTKPAAWAGLNQFQLRSAVQAYTANAVAALVAQGTPPHIIQIGNEITQGMLWNEGKVSYWGDPNWSNLAELLKAGILGAKAGAGSNPIQIMLHIDRGGDNPGTRAFFDRALQYAVPFDIIGLSYYPWWHGSLADFNNNITDLARRYATPILLAETAYPWTLQWSDPHPNFVWQSGQLLPTFPASIDGQRHFLAAVQHKLRRLPDGLGAGFCYWAPEFAPFPGLPSPWENLALFDFGGNALASWSAFSPFCPGDLNDDRFVDDADFVSFASSYDILDCAEPSMPIDCPADLNSDNLVDDGDFVLFSLSYNTLLCP